MSEELSPIEGYLAQWKPNAATVAILESLIAKAEREGNLADEFALRDQLREEMRPPSHLPIKNLDRT